jgi:hypothetical protein
MVTVAAIASKSREQREPEASIMGRVPQDHIPQAGADS